MIPVTSWTETRQYQTVLDKFNTQHNQPLHQVLNPSSRRKKTMNCIVKIDSNVKFSQ